MLDCDSDGSLSQMSVECQSLSRNIYLIISDFIECWHIFLKFARKSYDSTERENREMTGTRGTQEKGLGTRHEMHFRVSEKLFIAHHDIKHSKGGCTFEILIRMHRVP